MGCPASTCGNGCAPPVTISGSSSSPLSGRARARAGAEARRGRIPGQAGQKSGSGCGTHARDRSAMNLEGRDVVFGFGGFVVAPTARYLCLDEKPVVVGSRAFDLPAGPDDGSRDCVVEARAHGTRVAPHDRRRKLPACTRRRSPKSTRPLQQCHSHDSRSRICVDRNDRRSRPSRT